MTTESQPTVRPQFTHNESEACITWWSENGHRVDVLIDTEDQRFMWIVKSADGKWSPGGDEPWPQALVDELAKLQERTP